MNRSQGWDLLLAVGMVFQSSQALAYSSYVTGLNNGIDAVHGASAQYIGSCDGCHGGGGQSTTMGRQFGLDFVSLQGSSWSVTVQNLGPLDSDGDGFNNQAEFIAGTDPSLSSSHPVVCSRAAPSLSISPSSQSGLPGVALVYALSITNNDSSSCAPSTLDLNVSSIAGFTSSLSMQSLVLAPGASGSSNLTLMSGASVAAASYPFTVNVSDALVSAHAKSVSGTAVVQAAPVCSRAPPSLLLSPSSQTAEPGIAKSYSLRITNNDSSVCASSNFSIALNAVAPLSGSVANSSLSIAPGANSSIQVSIQSDSAAANGSYSFSLAVSDPTVFAHSGSASGSLQVQAVPPPVVDNAPPSVPMNLQLVRANSRAATISWDASTDDLSGVAKYKILVDGQVVAESTRLRTRVVMPSGSHSITLQAVDGAGNVSAESQSLSVSL